MREYLLVLLATAFITYLTTPIARYFALRFGFMAKVRDRDVHDRPIPRLGGLAMVAGLLAGLSLASQLPLISNVFNDGSQIRALLAGAGILVLLGVIDDKWSIDGPVKLAGQTLAAAVMASQGISLIWLPLPFVQGTLSLDPLTGVLLTVLIVLITVEFGYSRATLPTLISALLVGMTLGFLPHNMFPARVFMGDTGSMLIGLMLAACAITLTGQTDPGALELTSVLPSFLLILLPLAVIAVPLFDLALAVMRRTRRGANIFTPDKEHLHHRLLERGHSHRRAVMLMHAGTALLAFATVSTAFIPFLYSLSALIAGLASLVYFGRRRDPKKVVVA